MEDLFGINARRQAVAENIEKAMTVGFTPDEELEKALGAGYDPNGEDDNVEKAHQVGDIHPNGKWVWTQLPSGKYDWRTIKKNNQQTQTKQNSAEVDKFMDLVKTFNGKYNDESKIAVVPTDKGNWDTYYDGHRLGIINGSVLSKKTAKDKNWYTEGNGRDHSSKKKEEKKDNLSQIGELKNGFKFKKDTEYVLRYNKYERQYEVFENKTQRGAGKVPMWVCKSDNGDEKFGEKILKVVQKNYAKEGSTISFGNKTYPLSL